MKLDTLSLICTHFNFAKHWQEDENEVLSQCEVREMAGR